MMTRFAAGLGLTAALMAGGTSGTASAYPLDGYAETGIRRLEVYRMQATGEIPNRNVPKGAQLPTAAVEPRLIGRDIQFDIGSPDAGLSRQLKAALGAEAPDYGVAVLDLSNPDEPLYFEYNGGVTRKTVCTACIKAGKIQKA